MLSFLANGWMDNFLTLEGFYRDFLRFFPGIEKLKDTIRLKTASSSDFSQKSNLHFCENPFGISSARSQCTSERVTHWKYVELLDNVISLELESWYVREGKKANCADFSQHSNNFLSKSTVSTFTFNS